jgi:hypothetical protein
VAATTTSDELMVNDGEGQGSDMSSMQQGPQSDGNVHTVAEPVRPLAGDRSPTAASASPTAGGVWRHVVNLINAASSKTRS